MTSFSFRCPSQLLKRISRLHYFKTPIQRNVNLFHRITVAAPSAYHDHVSRSFASGSSSAGTDTTSGRNNVTDGTDLHKFYKEQLLELENERIELFGKHDSSSNDDQQQPPFMETNMTLEEMNTNREAIYAFTKEEKAAWGSSITDKPLSSELLDAINKARETKAVYEASMQKDLEEKIYAMALDDMLDQNSSSGGDSGSSSSDQEQSQNDSISFDSNNEIYSKTDHHHSYFTHLNPKGDEATMVDVGGKEITRRVAVARTAVVFPQEVMEAFDITSASSYSSSSSSSCTSGTHEMIGTKGPIFATAKLAGIMGAKRTSDLIPLCHPLPLEKVRIDIRLEGNRALIECECCVTHKTGVEMEAMAGASIAALTIYDMVKAVSHRVRIERTELVTKVGGKRIVQDRMERKRDKLQQANAPYLKK